MSRIKRRFESSNAEGKISKQFENFKIYKDLHGKPLQRDWVAKVVFPYKSFQISEAVAIAPFEI